MARMSRKNSPTASVSTEPDQSVYHTGIYLRLSLEDNGKKDSDSIESQKALLMDYISHRPNFTLTDIYMDNGYTGTDFNRPEFNRMMEDVKKGRINCILVKDLSRLGRNYVEAGDYLEKVFPFLHIRFIAVNDNYDSETVSSGDQLGVSLKNIVNDMYAKDISRKVSTALKAKRLRGDYIGNYAPYGYLKDPENHSHLIVDPETAPIVAEIFKMRAKGIGIATIARTLNEKDYPSPGRLRYERGIMTNNNQKGKNLPWNRHVLSDLLRNVAYIGNLAQGRHRQSLFKGISYYQTEKDEWDVAEHTHEPIISLELWEKAQAVDREQSQKAKENSGKYSHLPRRKNPYGSLIRCADCGRVVKFIRSYAKGGKRDYYNYKCPGNIELGDTVCPKKNIRADDLDRAVLETLRRQMDLFMDTQKVLQDFLDLKQEGNRIGISGCTHHKLQEETEKYRKRFAVLYTDYREGLLTQEEYIYAKQKYQEKLEALEQKNRELQKLQPITGADQEKKNWKSIIDQYYNASEISEEMVKAMVKEIRLYADNSISVEFHFMDEFDELIQQCERLRKETA